jgi:hypothetical protein
VRGITWRVPFTVDDGQIVERPVSHHGALDDRSHGGQASEPAPQNLYRAPSLPSLGTIMRSNTWAAVAGAVALYALAACRVHVAPDATPSAPLASLAKVYYWRAKPGMLAAYNTYIRDVARPIDEDARQHGAFISVTTYQSHDTLSPWTHMRVFLLRDSAQLVSLGAALDAAGARIEPDSVKRRARSDYAATLRDAAGSAVLDIIH